MATLTEIREGLATRLGAITNVQASAYMLANPTPPWIEVTPGPIEYDKAFQRGFDGWNLKVHAYAGSVSDIGAQKRLDPFLDSSGSTSIKAIIEGDTTLSGVVDDLRVTRCSGYRLYGRDGGAPVLGVEWDVEVWAGGE